MNIWLDLCGAEDILNDYLKGPVFNSLEQVDFYKNLALEEVYEEFPSLNFVFLNIVVEWSWTKGKIKRIRLLIEPT